MWDLIVSVPDHCLSFYFNMLWLPYNAQYSAKQENKGQFCINN